VRVGGEKERIGGAEYPLNGKVTVLVACFHHVHGKSVKLRSGTTGGERRGKTDGKIRVTGLSEWHASKQFVKTFQGKVGSSFM